jgi:hypothetical protein
MMTISTPPAAAEIVVACMVRNRLIEVVAVMRTGASAWGRAALARPAKRARLPQLARRRPRVLFRPGSNRGDWPRAGTVATRSSVSKRLEPTRDRRFAQLRVASLPGPATRRRRSRGRSGYRPSRALPYRHRVQMQREQTAPCDQRPGSGAGRGEAAGSRSDWPEGSRGLFDMQAGCPLPRGQAAP